MPVIRVWETLKESKLMHVCIYTCGGGKMMHVTSRPSNDVNGGWHQSTVTDSIIAHSTPAPASLGRANNDYTNKCVVRGD